MRTCTRCNVEKNESHFRPKGRGRSQTCKACEGVDQGEAVIAAQPGNGHAPDLVTPKLHGALEIPAGLGFRASVEDDTLQLEQDRPDTDGTVYTHNLTLTRVEAQRFIDWLAKLVEPQVAA